ncbi:hypothetical protein CORT_0C00260 [Candida orthopsilosis Co 90-125]|uniref:Septation initiation network scaffold protein cdc11 n=1 Tax=Candida orthopsilosis (strain 90-125) TaxID=1136231 RepID=H8X3D2_CANO9|nr:hypothetical protein CORT_0C00260 [Candida orthopsilosis Co 90-125]CCG25405.1 hypothetical protein CORT_0C00260 [Candida orthopsilosis Co 90-125]
MNGKDVSTGNLTTGGKIRDQREANSKRVNNSYLNNSNLTANHSKENQTDKNLKHQFSQPSFLNPRQPSVYQKRVNYIPNTNFSGNKSSLLIQDDDNSPQPSVPNTFHYKSHPNAKSKELGRSILVEDDQHNSSRQNSHSFGVTPQWMPEELNEKWTQPLTNDDPNINTGSNLLNQNIGSMEFQHSSTVIHNSGLQMNENLPWKSGLESPAEKNLRGIFHNSKELSNKEATTSTVTSTPVGTTRRVLSTLRPVTFNSNELKPQSPLKLYNDNYDTFTRNKLEGVLQNIASNKNTPAQINDEPNPKRADLQMPPLIENLQTSNIPPRLSIKDFTKTKSYTASAYKVNADNVFSELMKKGPQGNIDRMRSVSKETATSTPKRNTIYAEENHDSHYSSFSTGYSSEEKSVLVNANVQQNRISTEFTSITNDSESRSEMEMNEIDSEMTFESRSEMAEEINDLQKSLYTQDFSNSHKSGSERLGSSRTLESDQSNHLEPMHLNSNEKDSIGTIKLKSKSELRGRFITPVVNGKVEPNISLCHDYPGMVFDPVNLKWISVDEQNKTLDNIADLTDDEIELTGILKKERSRARKGNFEVSFQDQNSFSKSSETHDNGLVAGDVTKVSQIMDASFSESRKKLVSSLTNVLDLKLGISAWKEVESLDLSHCELSSLIDLFEFVPKLKELKVTNNHIKYLAGLPSSIRELDLSANEVENRSSFSELRDLHRLTLEHNFLTETTNISGCIHLTVLKLSHNGIDDISGLKNLSNLVSLDLSFNKVKQLNLKEYDWTNLQELDVSNNIIEGIENINHLYSLRILNCNKNQISKIDFASTSLRKLLLNQNNLSYIDLRGLRQLYCVRFDGNVVTHLEFPRHNLIELISMKSQPNMSQIWNNSAPQCDQLHYLDLSGNTFLPTNSFPLINELTLSAMNLSQLPTDFAQLFPNVQYLNLNFNKLQSVEPLTPLKGLKKLWLVSNKLSNFYLTMKQLRSSNKKLVLLDQRLNSYNKSFYDFIFTPDETNVDIELATVEDIEVFAERLDEMDRTQEWEERDEAFQRQLETRRDMNTIKGREVYQSSTIMFFKHLRSLDGIPITNAYRRDAYLLYRKLFPKRSK